MINNLIKNLQQQISVLENRLEKFENKTENIIANSACAIWTNNLLNINIVNRKTIDIKTIKNISQNNFFCQLTIKFFNYSKQNIKFDLFCDNIQIGSEQNNYENGLFETTIVGTYQNLISNKLKIKLSINPKNNKQVTILSTKLTIWGISQDISQEYDALLTNTNCILTYLSNNRLYYKMFNKELNDINFDFKYLNNSISHSICSDNDKVFLFRVDTNGNLFFSNFLENQENFISKNVNKVSSCFFDNSIYFSYISNGDCYYGEIINNIVISNKKITTLLGKFSNCYMYSETINNKCYLILTKENGSNYLLENISKKLCSSENIIADINLLISTQEGELWISPFIIN